MLAMRRLAMGKRVSRIRVAALAGAVAAALLAAAVPAAAASTAGATARPGVVRPAIPTQYITKAENVPGVHNCRILGQAENLQAVMCADMYAVPFSGYVRVYPRIVVF